MENERLTTLQSLTSPSAATPRDSGAAIAWRILGGLFAISALCAVSVVWLDRPIALFVHSLLRGRGSPSESAINALTHIPDLHIALTTLLVIVLGFTRLIRGRPHLAGTRTRMPARTTDLLSIGFLAALAVIVADAIKAALKLGFGRTWPETWVQDNPSFIRDGVYGFFPFHGGMGWGSFPSGHITAVSASMTVLWLLWPRWRPAYALMVAGAALGLLGMDYHFLADILAGAYLGWAVGVATVRIGGLG